MNHYATLAKDLEVYKYEEQQGPFTIRQGTRIVNARYDPQAGGWRFQALLNDKWVGIQSPRKPQTL